MVRIDLGDNFAVVEFIDEDELVEVVPTTWLLNEEVCMWPSKLSVKEFHNAVKRQMPWKEGWTECRIKIKCTCGK